MTGQSPRTRLGYPFTPVPRSATLALKDAVLSREEYAVLAFLWDRADRRTRKVNATLDQISRGVAWEIGPDRRKPDTLSNLVRNLKRKRWLHYPRGAGGRGHVYTFELFPDPSEYDPSFSEPDDPSFGHARSQSTSGNDGRCDPGASEFPESANGGDPPSSPARYPSSEPSTSPRRECDGDISDGLTRPSSAESQEKARGEGTVGTKASEEAPQAHARTREGRAPVDDATLVERLRSKRAISVVPEIERARKAQANGLPEPGSPDFVAAVLGRHPPGDPERRRLLALHHEAALGGSTLDDVLDHEIETLVAEDVLLPPEGSR